PRRTGLRPPHPARARRGNARRQRSRDRGRGVRTGPRSTAGLCGMRRLEALRAVPVTARGVGLGAGALVLVLAGWRWGYPELVAVGAAAALACVAAVSVIAARPNLEVERAVAPDRVSAGEEAEVTLDVRNAGKWRSVSARAVDAYGGAT